MPNTNDTNNAVELIFSVKGKGEINGESGQLIKSQITQIADNLHPKVVFEADVSKLESKLREIKKKYSSITTNVTGSGKGSGSTNKSTSSQLDSYQKMNSLLKQMSSLWAKANQAGKEGTAVAKEYTKQYQQAFAEYSGLAKGLNPDLTTADVKKQVEEATASVRALTKAKQEDYAATQADKTAAQYKTLQAALSELINRYSHMKV